jgi:membrane-bound lytic murein transglycosylase C
MLIPFVAALLAIPGVAPDTDDFLAEAEREAVAFHEAVDLERRDLEREIALLWGSFVASDRSLWSTYTGTDRHGEVDFERGEVLVEVLVPGSPERPDASVVAGLAEQMTAMMAPPDSPGWNPIVGLVDGGRGAPLEPGNVGSAVRERVERREVARRVVTGTPDGDRTVFALRFPMVQDHLRRAARPYLPLVEEFSRRFGLEPDLVLAVIHTESHFNPFARSAANAHGLMQLVPHQGASDAWAHARGSPRVVPVEELYQPRLNVELGTAYLRVLLDQFASLQDPASALLAAVAAYNCGPGNTRRVLAGPGALGTLPASTTPAQIRAALLLRAPVETREYVRLVLERRRIWLGATSGSVDRRG